jgi:hypothetical protein
VFEWDQKTPDWSKYSTWNAMDCGNAPLVDILVDNFTVEMTRLMHFAADPGQGLPRKSGLADQLPPFAGCPPRVNGTA